MNRLLFLSGVGFQELIILVMSPALCVGIFLVFRAFFLWYWKINVIVKNQELQNRLLSELITVNKMSRKPAGVLSTDEKGKQFDQSQAS
jgi:hypothetical protein